MAHHTLHPTEHLESLTQTAEHLAYLDRLLQHPAIPTETRHSLTPQLQRIRQKLQDPTLNLAIIGEFSSGKSTFINALLRDELLATSALVATAVATRLQSGKTLQAHLTLKTDPAQRTHTLSAKNPQPIPGLSALSSTNLRDRLRQLTTQEDIAQTIDTLRIDHPAPFLNNGIVIIDTPGLNAYRSGHRTITQQVVEQDAEQDADLALITIPATQPLSQSLTDILQSTLKPYLHRCLFILTRMDQIRPAEQDTLIQDVTARLQEQLGLTQPKLYPCAAQIVLDHLAAPTDIPAAHRPWLDQFSQLETHLQQHLRQQKSLAIAESLLRLLNTLFSQLETHLRDQQNTYTQRQADLERNILPNFAEFMGTQFTSSQRALQSALETTTNQTRRQVAQTRQQAIAEIRQAIFSTADPSELETVIETHAQQILKQQTQALQTILKQQLSTLQTAGYKTGQTFEDTFTQAYRRLNRLGGNTDIAAAAASPLDLDTAAIFNSVLALHSELGSQVGGAFMGGMATGAAIGTAILPGVGTVIGGFVGGWLSASMFGPSLSDRQQKIWESLSPTLDQYFNQLDSLVRQRIEDYAHRIESALQRRLETYNRQYADTAEQLWRDQQQAQRELAQLQTFAQTSLTEIEGHRQSVRRAQQQLAQAEG